MSVSFIWSFHVLYFHVGENAPEFCHVGSFESSHILHLESYVRTYYIQLEVLTQARKQYYINSFTHRSKLRVLQTLLIITHSFVSEVLITGTYGQLVCSLGGLVGV